MKGQGSGVGAAMECVEFEEMLQRRLDERLVPGCPELLAHAVTCPACQLLLEDAGLLSRGVAAWRMSLPVADSDLTSRITEDVLAVIRAEQTASPATIKLRREVGPGDAPQSWQSWAVVAGTVAAICLVFLGSPARDPVVIRSVTLGRYELPVAAPKPKADLGRVLVSAEGAYSHLANESLAAARDFALLWPAGNVTSTDASKDPPAEDDAAGWSPDLSEELAPIGDSVEDAWNFLRRTVPQVEKMRT